MYSLKGHSLSCCQHVCHVEGPIQCPCTYLYSSWYSMTPTAVCLFSSPCTHVCNQRVQQHTSYTKTSGKFCNIHVWADKLMLLSASWEDEHTFLITGKTSAIKNSWTECHLECKRSLCHLPLFLARTLPFTHEHLGAVSCTCNPVSKVGPQPIVCCMPSPSQALMYM